MEILNPLQRSIDGQHLLFAGRYLIAEKIADGGTASVYRATDLEAGTVVAVKLLHPHFASDRHLEYRFKQEMRAVSSLNHPNIVKILSSDIDEKHVPYMIMELVDGVDLSVFIKKETIELATFFDIMSQVCSALAHAHSRGVIHRDVKPGNIIIERKNSTLTAKLVDFGIARLLDSQDKATMVMTHTGSTIGSPAYMSPEQARGLPADVRSDVYSLACVMFEVLTGGPPFVAEHILKVFFKHAECKPPDLSELTNHAYPENLNLLIQKCLEKDPDARYQNMFDLRIDLERLSAGLEPLLSSNIVHDQRQSSSSLVSSSTADEDRKVTQIFSGTLSYEMRLNQVLQRVANLSTPALSILILESDSLFHTGFIMIQDGKSIIGATVPGLKCAGYPALKRLMTIADGKFTYISYRRDEERGHSRLHIELSDILLHYPKVPRKAGEEAHNDTDPMERISISDLEKCIFSDTKNGAIRLNQKGDDWRQMPKRSRGRGQTLKEEFEQTFSEQPPQSAPADHNHKRCRHADKLVIWLLLIDIAIALCLTFYSNVVVAEKLLEFSTTPWPHAHPHLGLRPRQP